MLASFRSPSGARSPRTTSAIVAVCAAAFLGCEPVGGELPADADALAPVATGSGSDGVAYVIGATRVGAVVVVVESVQPLEPVDAPAAVAASAGGTLRRPGGDPLRSLLARAPLPGGTDQVRTTSHPAPLSDCVSVTPWSGASAFSGVRFDTPGGPRATVNQFVLRYPDGDRAAEQLERIGNQVEDCPHPALDVRPGRRALAVDDLVLGAFLLPGTTDRFASGGA